MGVDFHITRAADWAQNDDAQITADAWLAYVAGDAELTLYPTNGQYFVLWSGPSAYDEPWLDWRDGNISTKWPDTALYKKMLRIAAALNATIQDDEGNVYSQDTDWEFDPTARRR